MNLWRWNTGIDGSASSSRRSPRARRTGSARCEVPRRKGGAIDHGMINDADTLRWLAHQNCITPHVWNAAQRQARPAGPDRVRPRPDAASDFDEIREARAGAAAMLRELGLTPFAMITGSRGIHVVAPLKRTRTPTRCASGRARSPSGSRPAPGHADHRLAQGEARGQILVDIARNTYGQTVVAPYAVRALPGAPVATPLDLGRGGRSGAAPRGVDAARHCATGCRAGDPWAEIERPRGDASRD